MDEPTQALLNLGQRDRAVLLVAILVWFLVFPTRAK